MNWIIDANLRRATNGTTTVQFYYDGERWGIETPANGKIQQGSKQALVLWLDALNEGAEMLTAAGQACFGEGWMMQMANELGLNRRSIQRWLSLAIPLTTEHSVWPQVMEVMAKRQREMGAQIETIKSLTKTLAGIRNDG